MISFRNLLFISLMLANSILNGQSNIIVYGNIMESINNEILVGANVYVPQNTSGTISNSYGFYSMNVKIWEDSVSIEYSFVGFKTSTLRIKPTKDTIINVILDPLILKEVVIVSSYGANTPLFKKPGLIKISQQELNNTTSIFGERDAFSFMQLLPGITSSNESSGNISVRGGGPDQNLIILDDAPVYGLNHLFGYFSSINTDIIKTVNLWKGGFPCKYGGKLSSVIDIITKDGDNEKWHAGGGIGVISSHIFLEGPIMKERSSLIFSVRRSNLDYTLPFILPDLTDYSRYHFYDINLKYNQKINNNNKFYVSTYLSEDNFHEPGTQKSNFLHWNNRTGTLRWNHIYNPRLFTNSTLVYSKFKFQSFQGGQNGQDTNYNFNYQSSIESYDLKFDLEYYLKASQIKAGFQISNQLLEPEILVSKLYISQSNPSESHKYYITTISPYCEMNFDLPKNHSATLGFRFNTFKTNKKFSNIIEPRFKFSKEINQRNVITISYTRTAQPIHLLSSSGIGLSSDLWIPSTDSIPVETADQCSIGFNRQCKRWPVFWSVEGYYKKLQNIIGYKPGASFLNLSGDPDKINIPSWKESVMSGRGQSFGIELLVKKNEGNLNWFVSYTISKALQHFDLVRTGALFPADYDRRHKISAFASYQLKPDKSTKNKKLISANWIFLSGKPITLPISIYYLNPNIYGNYPVKVVEYGEYNGFRLKAYHRLDLSFQLQKQKKHYYRTWEFGIYNTYNKFNAYKYSLELNINNGKFQTTLKETCYFPILPYITYSIKF